MGKSNALLLTILIAYVALAAGTAHALRPWADEAWHGAPAWCLAFRGYMGTPGFVQPSLKDISRYTYWIMPLYPLIQAAWYQVFPFSLGWMRALSIVCALAGMLAWASFFRRLTRDNAGAVLFLALMGCDYVSLAGAGYGRPEAMAFAFQAGAFAAYLHWRERNLGLAIFVSQLLVVASGMTHPNGGLLGFFAMLWLMIYLDRRRMRPVYLAWAAIPYLVAAAGWGAYILRDPSAFVAQYGYQISVRPLRNPWDALRYEWYKRYLHMLGFQYSPGSTGPHYLKMLIYAAYAASIAGLLIIRRLRQTPAAQVLLGMLVIYFLFFTFLEGTKAPYYFIYFIYVFTAVLVVFVRGVWQTMPRRRSLVVSALTALFLLQIGGDLYRIRRDVWHNEYLPAAAFLRAHAAPGDLIAGSYDLGFLVGFQNDFVDDDSLGVYTGKRPEYIFVEEIYQDRFVTACRQPQECAVLRNQLADYQVLYDAKNYQVFKLRNRIAQGKGL